MLDNSSIRHASVSLSQFIYILISFVRDLDRMWLPTQLCNTKLHNVYDTLHNNRAFNRLHYYNQESVL